MKTVTFKKTLVAASLMSLAALVGCSADGSGVESGAIISDGGTSTPPLNNDGSTPTNIVQNPDANGANGTSVTGTGQGFVCTQGALAFGAATTQVGANGLVGALLTPLLNLLGANPATALLNSVTEPNNVIDGKLSTYATFTLPASLLTSIVDSVDERVNFPSPVPAGNYAVFGVTFPAGTLNLGLTRTLTISTYLGGTQQEKLVVNVAQLQLLGFNLAGDTSGFFGLKTSKNFDAADVELSSSLLSVDVGSAVRVHELCTGGKVVTAPTS